MGCSSPEPAEYTVYGEAAAREVRSRAGRVSPWYFAGTGLGISMAANKVDGIRAALCTNEFMARMARLHNDANVLAMGGRVLGKGLAEAIMDAFLATQFEGGRHAARVSRLMEIEKRH